MRAKISLYVLIFIFLIASVSSVTINNACLGRNIQSDNLSDNSVPISCVDETDHFTTLDPNIHFVFSTSSWEAFEVINITVFNPQFEKVVNEEISLTQNIFYPAYHAFTLQTLALNNDYGVWTVRIIQKGIENPLLTIPFTFSEGTTSCSGGNSCCLTVCADPQQGECEQGVCCISESCLSSAPTEGIIYQEIANCEAEGLSSCEKPIGLIRNYNIHGVLATPQTIELTYSEDIVDCYDKTDVAVGYYDEINEEWEQWESQVEQLSEDTYKVTAAIDFLGYISLVRSYECVPTSCFYGGYLLNPFFGEVLVGDSISFTFCGLNPNCTAVADGVCDTDCPGTTDPDCPESCTSLQDNCCLPSADAVCDLDCAEDLDPDCICNPSLGCCMLSSADTSCNIHCSAYQSACPATNSPSDGCNAEPDGVCDTDCRSEIRHENYTGEQGWAVVRSVDGSSSIPIDGFYASSIKLESSSSFKIGSGSVSFSDGSSFSLASSDFSSFKSFNFNSLKDVQSISLSTSGQASAAQSNQVKVSLYGFTKIWSLDPDCCAYAQKTPGNCCPMKYSKSDKDDVCDSDCIVRGTDPDC